MTIFFVQTSLTGFINTFVMISIGDISYPLNDVIFPSIVVCNNDQVSRSFINELNLTSDEVQVLMKQFITGRPDDPTPEERRFLDQFLLSPGYQALLHRLTERSMDNPAQYIDSDIPLMDNAFYPWKILRQNYKELSDERKLKMGVQLIQWAASHLNMPGKTVPHFHYHGAQVSPWI